MEAICLLVGRRVRRRLKEEHKINFIKKKFQPKARQG